MGQTYPRLPGRGYNARMKKHETAKNSLPGLAEKHARPPGKKAKKRQTNLKRQEKSRRGGGQAAIPTL